MQMQGGLIRSADVAIQIAEVLGEAHYGMEEFARQKPLIAVDNGSYWRVEGSLNRDGKSQGRGNFFLSIDKYDGRVVDIGTWLRNPQGEEFLREVMAAKTPEEKNALVMKRLDAVRQTDEKKK
jgi:hypothetical protein